MRGLEGEKVRDGSDVYKRLIGTVPIIQRTDLFLHHLGTRFDGDFAYLTSPTDADAFLGKVVKLSQLSESTFSVRIDTTQLRSYTVTQLLLPSAKFHSLSPVVTYRR